MSTKFEDAFVIFNLDNKSRRFSHNTLLSYESKLTAFFTYCHTQNIATIEEITPTIIRAYLVVLQDKGLKDLSISGALKAIKRFLNFCVSEELLLDTPMKKVTAPKFDKEIIPALTADEIKTLLKHTQFERDRVMILFMLDTLVRASECAKLNVEDLDMKTGAVTVHLGKGNKSRVTYMGAKTQRRVMRYLVKRGNLRDKSPLFVSERGGARLTLSGIDQIFRRLRQHTNIDVTPHDLRRTGCLFLLKQGMSIYHLQKLMGHTDISTLKHYLALLDEDVKDAHDKFGVVDNLF